MPAQVFCPWRRSSFLQCCANFVASRMKRILSCFVVTLWISMGLYIMSMFLLQKERFALDVPIHDKQFHENPFLQLSTKMALQVDTTVGPVNTSVITESKQKADPIELIRFKQKGTFICREDDFVKSAEVNKLGTYPLTKRFLTLGISSITRPNGVHYLSKTVRGLINYLSDSDKKEVFIVVFLADFDDSPKEKITQEFSTSFTKYIEKGLLHVISSPRQFYPSLLGLKKKYGDSDSRVQWRSKQNIDFAFIMCYCSQLSEYYLHLEDDVTPAPSYLPKLKLFISSQQTRWAMLDAAYMGHVGKVYHTEDLNNIATFLYLLYDEMPVDWLIIYWRAIKNDRRDLGKFVLPPASLFEHIGDASSFIENKQSHLSKEKYFDQFDQKFRGLNPPAIVTTSLAGEKGHAPEHAYNQGGGYYWAKSPQKDDFLMIEFKTPERVKKVFVDTGSYLAPDDKLVSGVVQASFAYGNASYASCMEFKTVATFQNGKADVVLGDGKDHVCKLRILVTQTQSTWLFVREIDVWHENEI